MTKLSYTRNNLVHTIEGSKDDILAELIDMVTDDMTIVVGNLSLIKPIPKKTVNTSDSSVPKKSSPKKRRTPRYNLDQEGYKAYRLEVLKAWDTGQYNRVELYRMFPKAGKSTIARWINDHIISSNTTSPSATRNIIRTSQINTPASEALNKLLSKEA